MEGIHMGYPDSKDCERGTRGVALSLKFGIIVMLAMLSVLCLTATAIDDNGSDAASGDCGDGVKWSLSSGTLSITYSGSGTGKMTDYPDGGKNTPWYDQRASIRTATVGEGVTSIGDLCFRDCENLSSVTIANSVTSIGNNAFMKTAIKTITLPSKLTSIGTYCFSGCQSLQSIEIPDSVITIGHDAFMLCTSMRTATIGSGTTTIGEGAFSTSGALQSIDVSASNSRYSSKDGVLYDKGQSTLIQFPSGKQGQVSVPSGVRTIANYAFDGCKYIQSVNIPDTVTSLGEFSFNFCTSMQSINMGSGVSSIGTYAFFGCSVLRSITFPANISIIKESAFEDCYSLVSFTFPKNIPIIENSAFALGTSDHKVTCYVKSDYKDFLEPYSDKYTKFVYTAPTSTYTITFDANGGTPATTTLVTGTNGKLSYLPKDPVYEGHAFQGWFTSKTGGTQVTLNTVFTSDSTVYAQWSSQVIPVTDVTLNRTEATLNVGDYIDLLATVSPSDATDKRVKWLSSNNSIATVDSSGHVVAKGVGEVRIIVSTVDGDHTAECAVTVTSTPHPIIHVTDVTLDKKVATMKVGDSLRLVATVSPSNADDKTVTWQSDDPTVATVDANGNVRAISAGDAAITVITVDGKKTATCVVSVTDSPQPVIHVTSVELNTTSATLNVGGALDLVAEVKPADATDKSVKWSSSDDSIATVNAVGHVVAKAAGTVTITVTTNDRSKTATCEITVKDIPVESITLDKTSLSLTVGGSYKLKATVVPSDVPFVLEWSSSDTSVATVDQDGNVKAVSKGSAVITVASGGVKATCSVSVDDAPAPAPQNDNTLLYVGIAVVILILIIVAVFFFRSKKK